MTIRENKLTEGTKVFFLHVIGITTTKTYSPPHVTLQKYQKFYKFIQILHRLALPLCPKRKEEKKTKKMKPDIGHLTPEM